MKTLLDLIDAASTMFWCPEPYMTLEQKTMGNYGVCCRSAPLPYTVHDKNIQEHFNSKEMKALRAEMESGQVGQSIGYYCRKCLMHEKSGITSKRQRRVEQLRYISQDSSKQRFIDGFEHAANAETIDISKMGVYIMEFKFFGNLCNLNCLMCHPKQSSSIAKDWKDKGKWNGPVVINLYADLTEDKRSIFFEEMRRMLPNTLQVKFTGGEPMINKNILELIDFIVQEGFAKDIILRVVTNATVLPERFTSCVKHFKRFICQVSVDGVWDVNDYQRVGANFNTIDRNINKILTLPNTQASITTAVTALNCGHVEDIYLYALHKNLGIDLSSIVVTPSYMMPQVLPQDLKDKYIQKLEKSVYRDKFADVITALKDTSTFTETQRQVEYVRLLNRLEERDLQHGTSYEDILC